MNEPSHYGMPEKEIPLIEGAGIRIEGEPKAMTIRDNHLMENGRCLTHNGECSPPSFRVKNRMDEVLGARYPKPESNLLQDAHILLMQARASFDADSDFRADVDRWVARLARESSRL